MIEGYVYYKRSNDTPVANATIEYWYDGVYKGVVLADTTGWFAIDTPLQGTYTLYVNRNGKLSQPFYADSNDTNVRIEIDNPQDSKQQSEPSETELSVTTPNILFEDTTALERSAYLSGANAKIFLTGAVGEPVELDIPIIQFSIVYDQNPIYLSTDTHYSATMGKHYQIVGSFQLNLTESLAISRRLNIGSVLDLPPFDLLTEFVEDFRSEKRVVRYLLSDVHLTGMSHIVTADGEPVGESYEFIAKRAMSQNLSIPEIKYKVEHNNVTP